MCHVLSIRCNCLLVAFIEEGYHSTNPYHNSIHATDVTQAMHCFLQENKVQVFLHTKITLITHCLWQNKNKRNHIINLQIKKHLTNLEIMASLIAAVTHDLDHPGVNQPFLVATSNHLAALYQVETYRICKMKTLIAFCE